MVKKIVFESDYIKKLLQVSFSNGYKIKSVKDISFLKQEWLKALSSWHSPYKVVIDCSNLEIENSEKTIKSLVNFIKLLEALHLRKICGFSAQPLLGHELLPFEVFKTKEQAYAAIGIRSLKEKKSDHTFRSMIQIDNHFKQGIMELSFLDAVEVSSVKDLLQLKKKIMNNLILWHDSWSLAIDCSQLKIKSSVTAEFSAMLKLFKGFFLKQVVGYLPLETKDNYPFKTYRSRHKVFVLLSNENSDRDVGNCQTRKS
jgi:hypothetical protein